VRAGVAKPAFTRLWRSRGTSAAGPGIPPAFAAAL